MYYTVQIAPQTAAGIQTEPQLPQAVSFRSGAPIRVPLATPLVFQANNTTRNPPRHWEGLKIPLLSDLLCTAFADIGISNLQKFQAKVANTLTGESWRGYSAVNIVGMIACADLDASDYSIEARRADDRIPACRFRRLVVRREATCDQSLFRLAESPDTILAAARVIEGLDAHGSLAMWNISASPVEETG